MISNELENGGLGKFYFLSQMLQEASNSGSGSSALLDFDAKSVVPRGKLMGVGRDWDFSVLYVVVVVSGVLYCCTEQLVWS